MRVQLTEIKTRSEFHRTAGAAAAADQATPQQTATYADLGLWWWNYRQEASKVRCSS